jgi:hypothetical protein
MNLLNNIAGYLKKPEVKVAGSSASSTAEPKEGGGSGVYTAQEERNSLLVRGICPYKT